MEHENQNWKVTQTKENGLLHISGSLMFNGSRFTFSFREQQRGMYRLRGRVALRAVDGKILPIDGPRRRAVLERMRQNHGGTLPQRAEHSDSLLAVKQVFLHTTQEEALRAAVQKAAEELYAENLLAIQDDMSSARVDKTHPADAVRLYMRRFFASYPRPITQETRRRKERRLQKIASKLDRYTMDSIPARALLQLHQELGSKGDELFRLAGQFWRFCMEMGIYQGQNPFDQYFLRNPSSGRKPSEEMQWQALKPASLPKRVEQALNRWISEASPDDTRYTGMLLVKDAGFPSSEACALLWTDLLFNRMGRSETTVQFAIQKEFIAGATHDYTRPGTTFCANELFRRARACLERWGSLENHYVLEDFSGKRLAGKQLTEFCRERLLHSGMDYGSLAPDRSQPHGVGVRLLLAHYKHRITYLAGLREDSETVRFLMGLSLAGNVSADHYRDFTSPEGQNFLWNILNRDKGMEEAPPAGDLIHTSVDGNTTTITVKAPEPNRFNHIIGSIRLEKGQFLDIQSPNLLHGHLKIKKPSE